MYRKGNRSPSLAGKVEEPVGVDRLDLGRFFLSLLHCPEVLRGQIFLLLLSLGKGGLPGGLLPQDLTFHP